MGKTPQPRPLTKKFKLYPIKVYVHGLPHHTVTYVERTWGAALEKARAYVHTHRALFPDAVLYPIKPAKNFLLTIDYDCIQLLNDKVGNGSEHLGIPQGTYVYRVAQPHVADHVGDSGASAINLAEKEG